MSFQQRMSVVSVAGLVVSVAGLLPLRSALTSRPSVDAENTRESALGMALIANGLSPARSWTNASIFASGTTADQNARNHFAKLRSAVSW